MNIAAIQTFLAIVETGSLVRASERLNVTQSTVTARLKTLEESLGQTLINRSKSGASCTSAGLRLQRYAQTISGMWRQARLEVSSPTGSRVFRNCAVHTDLWDGWGERLFSALDAHEDISVSLFSGGEADLTNWLDQGLVDTALGYVPITRAGVINEAVGEDRLMLVSTNSNAPLRFDPGYIFVDYGEDFSQQHMTFYADANSARLTFSAPSPALSYILQTGGTAYLPERMVQGLLAQQRLFLLVAAPVFTRAVFLNRKEGAAVDASLWHLNPSSGGL